MDMELGFEGNFGVLLWSKIEVAFLTKQNNRSRCRLQSYKYIEQYAGIVWAVCHLLIIYEQELNQIYEISNRKVFKTNPLTQNHLALINYLSGESINRKQENDEISPNLRLVPGDLLSFPWIQHLLHLSQWSSHWVFSWSLEWDRSGGGVGG